MANLVTLSRLVLLLIVAWSFYLPPSPWHFVSFVLTILIFVSDGIDGWLARKLRQDSGAGRIVDPITDKLFVLVALATLTAQRLLAPWMVLALLARDIYTSFAFFIVMALNWSVRFKARFAGKTATVLQLAVMIAALLWPAAVLPLVLATLLVSLLAIIDYTRAILAERRRAA